MSQHTQFAPQVNFSDQRTEFPLCLLHNVRLVFSLPQGCPHDDEYPDEVLSRLQDDAWARMSQVDLSGLVLKERYEICAACRLPRDIRDRLRHRIEKPVRPQLAASEPITVRRVRK